MCFLHSQEEVYKMCVESLVKSIFEGYNATVFAYGQTVRQKLNTSLMLNRNILNAPSFRVMVYFVEYCNSE